MKKLVIFLIVFCLCACTKSETNESRTTTIYNGPLVVSASKDTTASPQIEIITTPQPLETTSEEKVTTIPKTVKVTTYPISKVITETTPITTTLTSTSLDPSETTTAPEVTVTTSETTMQTTTYPFTPVYTKVTDKGYDAFIEINKLRIEKGLSEYELDEYLCIAANERAREIVEVQSHVRPNRQNFSTILDEYGYIYNHAQENYGIGYSDAYSMVYAWSHTNRDAKAIFDTEQGYQKIGVGYYYYAGKSYWVLLVID